MNKMNKSLHVIITGTNKGIGQDLVKMFLKNHQAVIVYATSRQKGEIFQERWKQIEGHDRIQCRQLEMSSEESIDSFVQDLAKQKVKIDMLIHNAAICNLNDDKEFMSKQWNELSLKTNLFGPILLSKKIISLLADDAIIAFVSSSLAALQIQPQQTHSMFDHAHFSKQDIYNAAHQYVKQSENNKMVKYSMSVYATSKMLLAAWSRFILQRQLLKGNQKAISVSPGFCKTQMTEHFIQGKLHHTSQSGALSIYKTLFLEDLNPQFFYHRARISTFQICGKGLPFE